MSQNIVEVNHQQNYAKLAVEMQELRRLEHRLQVDLQEELTAQRQREQRLHERVQREIRHQQTLEGQLHERRQRELKQREDRLHLTRPVGECAEGTPVSFESERQQREQRHEQRRVKIGELEQRLHWRSPDEGDGRIPAPTCKCNH